MSHLERDDRIVYQIQVRGVLGAEWSDWFDDLTISPQAGGDTLLTGPVRDQCALHGILSKIRDLGLPLLSLAQIEPTTAQGAHAEGDKMHKGDVHVA